MYTAKEHINSGNKNITETNIGLHITGVPHKKDGIKSVSQKDAAGD
jgi:hypothetical protein